MYGVKMQVRQSISMTSNESSGAGGGGESSHYVSSYGPTTSLDVMQVEDPAVNRS
jgi:hypothetical protein